ncbi:MAG: hypothetical protein KAG45_10850 [Methyloprofundus sp.]|nr:hypothetical protein [Methyloprofundus sp.]
MNRFVGFSLTLLDTVVDRVESGLYAMAPFKAGYNERSKKALAFSEIAIAEAIVLHASF